MKLTLGRIRVTKEPVDKLREQKGNLPLSMSYRFAKLLAHLDVEYNIMEQTREELVRKYGDPVEGEADKIEVQSEEKRIKFFNEYNEFLMTETELDITPLTEAEIAKIGDGVELHHTEIPLLAGVVLEDFHLKEIPVPALTPEVIEE